MNKTVCDECGADYTAAASNDGTTIDHDDEPAFVLVPQGGDPTAPMEARHYDKYACLVKGVKKLGADIKANKQAAKDADKSDPA